MAFQQFFLSKLKRCNHHIFLLNEYCIRKLFSKIEFTQTYQIAVIKKQQLNIVMFLYVMEYHYIPENGTFHFKIYCVTFYLLQRSKNCGPKSIFDEKKSWQSNVFKDRLIFVWNIVLVSQIIYKLLSLYIGAQKLFCHFQACHFSAVTRNSAFLFRIQDLPNSTVYL